MSSNDTYLILRPQEAQSNWLPSISLGKRVFTEDRDGTSISRSGRTRLTDIPKQYVCSVIGTCLTPNELRKLLGRLISIDINHMSDHDLHSEGVLQASSAGVGSRAIQKLLDKKHNLVIKKFSVANTETEVMELWNSEWLIGNIAGAYWAFLTHPSVGLKLTQKIFGDVHMLSHQVGSVNRADLKKLSELQSQVHELKKQLVIERDGYNGKLNAEDLARQKLESEFAARLSKVRKEAAFFVEHTDEEFHKLREQLKTITSKLAIEMVRRESIEEKHLILKKQLKSQEENLIESKNLNQLLHAELIALESELQSQNLDGKNRNETTTDLNSLDKKIFLYVGGHTGSIVQVRSWVNRFGGELYHHDGGVEDNPNVLTGLMRKADLVLFPVDCISHKSMWMIKRLAQKHDKNFVPLRSSGLGSFISAVQAKVK